MQAARIQAMRDSLEQQLEHCKSKEEAAKVFSDTMSMVSDKDPMKEYIVAAYQDAYNEFQKAGNTSISRKNHQMIINLIL